MKLLAVLCSLTIACGPSPEATKQAAPAEAPAAEAPTPAWTGEVQTHGALRAMFHQGQTGAMVSMDALLPNPRLVAIGALADLAGEVTVLDGRTVLSYPDGDGVKAVSPGPADAAATLLVAAEVPAWTSVSLSEPIAWDTFDAQLGALAEKAGMSLDGRFPFLIEGEVSDLRWHVIDGSKLTGGGGSHQDHLAAAVRQQADVATATLVGFYSAHDQGVFTHMGSKTHVHAVMGEPVTTGHVDHVVVPAGAVVRFPVDAGADEAP